MNRPPEFDELIGTEPQGADRERLRRAHELLLEAGPPPEVTPELERGPRAGTMFFSAKKRRRVRPVYLLAAAFVVVFALVFGLSGNRHHALGAVELRGTALAPQAAATLVILPPEGGTWPMRLDVTGLPASLAATHYEVYLVRNGRPIAPCGSFTVSGPNSELTKTLNAPYRIRPGDTWVVKVESGDGTGHGRTVMRPVRA